jgi:hypothetical protein
VTAFTDSEIIVAKSALTVMTRHTALRPTRRVMIERLRRGDLPPLRHACLYLMTLVAGHLLVLRMTKADSERLRELGCTGITTQLMARST